MEVEETFADRFPDLFFETPPEQLPLLMKTAPCAAGVPGNSPPESAGFDCNICLDFATDPVVTLCGHLYCWPCIYRWLLPTSNDNPHQCPVCKFPLSESHLVPLYGRGLTAKNHGRHLGIPDRPRGGQNLVSVDERLQRLASEDFPFYLDGTENHWGALNSTVGVVLGEMAFAMLPRAFAAPPNSYLSHTTAEGGRWRRQEMLVESWLKLLWISLLCSALFCLLLF